ncbi:hypothetical protein LTR15_010493 [Elasticomyces elasticus]|nr:hypothetical protein LTR15_010493 [Elasticomyces elasticus]
MSPAIPSKTTSTAPTTTDGVTCVTCGSNTGLERIDATRLNTLTDTLTHRLTHDVYGNQLSQSDNITRGTDNRHSELVELTSWRQEVDDITNLLNKYITLLTRKETAEEEKPIKMSRNVKELNATAEKQQTVIDNLNDKVERLMTADAARRAREEKANFNGKPQKFVDIASKAKGEKYDDTAIKTGLRTAGDRITALTTKVNARLHNAVDTLAVSELSARIDEVARLQTQCMNKAAIAESRLDVLDPSIQGIEKWSGRTSKQRAGISGDVGKLKRKTDRLGQWSDHIANGLNFLVSRLAKSDPSLVEEMREHMKEYPVEKQSD